MKKNGSKLSQIFLQNASLSARQTEICKLHEKSLCRARGGFLASRQTSAMESYKPIFLLSYTRVFVPINLPLDRTSNALWSEKTF